MGKLQLFVHDARGRRLHFTPGINWALLSYILLQLLYLTSCTMASQILLYPGFPVSCKLVGSLIDVRKTLEKGHELCTFVKIQGIIFFVAWLFFFL
jgi:hypothetical protein